MGIEAHAESCLKVLEKMAKGLTFMMFGENPVAANVTTKIHLCEEDPVELMVTWLNEILYWCEQNNAIPAVARIDSLKEGALSATLSGEYFDKERHHVERQVKAITYYQACLEEVSGSWCARVYVDL